MAELGDFLVSGDTTAKIDVDMLDYGYIGKCDDAKILRGIIDTLKSGKEGLYPELCQAAEDRLFSILPEKERRRVQRLQHKTTPDQVSDAEKDLNSWQSEVFRMDKELLSTIPVQTARKMPPVRGQKVEKLDIPAPKQVAEAPKLSTVSTDSNRSERLSGYDFHAWEKFNVDEALATLDEEEEEVEKEVQSKRLKLKARAEEAARKRMERHNKAMEVLRAEMNMSSLSNVQRKTRAAREKQKGNEAFRSGESEEAYSYYSRSLALDDSVAAVYSNRALVCLRMGKLETAEDDCSRALFLDPGFNKARSRRGITRLKSGKYELAIRDFELASEHESGNKELLSLLQKAKDKFLEVEGKPYISEKEKAHQRAVMQLAIANGLPVDVNSSSSPDALLRSVTASEAALVFSGVCETISNDGDDAKKVAMTRILIEDDSESESESECNGGAEDDALGFTRIQIDDDSDSEDDDIGELEQQGQEDGRALAPSPETADDAAVDGFVRIAISDATSDSGSDGDSDTEREPDEGGYESKAHGISAEKAQQSEAEALKSRANEAMKAGDLARAIDMYGECVALAGVSPVAIAAYGNRSLAHLKLEQYEKALADTSMVLTHEPNNLKALYRRSLALEAVGDLEGAIGAVDEIVCVQPQNALAIEARERFRQTQQSNAAVAAQKEEQRLQKEQAAALAREEEEQAVVSARKEEEQQKQKQLLERSVDLKNRGNEAMKAGQCAEAIELYSEAISCDASNATFYNNRAQAYLKISAFDKAEADASHVILDCAADSPNFKAYYRRALARKGLATAGSLRGALEDISYILEHEPDNKAALAEKQKISSLLRSRQREEREVDRSKVVTKDPNAGLVVADGLTERSSRVKSRGVEPDLPLTPDTTQPLEVMSSSRPHDERLQQQKEELSALSGSRIKTTAAKDISVKKPVVPSDPPKTVYEFERIWRGLRNHPDLFAKYLQCFKKSTFKKVIKDTCSPDLLSSLLVAVRDHLLVAGLSAEKGVSVLEGLSGIPKYDMMRVLLPSTDVDCITACLDYVSVHMGPERAAVLREKLKM